MTALSCYVDETLEDTLSAVIWSFELSPVEYRYSEVAIVSLAHATLQKFVDGHLQNFWVVNVNVKVENFQEITLK